MTELIGNLCKVEYSLPYIKQPFQGSEWIVVEGVDMPMIKIRSSHGNKSIWVNVKIIDQISAVEKAV